MIVYCPVYYIMQPNDIVSVSSTNYTELNCFSLCKFRFNATTELKLNNITNAVSAGLLRCRIASIIIGIWLPDCSIRKLIAIMLNYIKIALI